MRWFVEVMMETIVLFIKHRVRQYSMHASNDIQRELQWLSVIEWNYRHAIANFLPWLDMKWTFPPNDYGKLIGQCSRRSSQTLGQQFSCLVCRSINYEKMITKRKVHGQWKTKKIKPRVVGWSYRVTWLQSYSRLVLIPHGSQKASSITSAELIWCLLRRWYTSASWSSI